MVLMLELLLVVRGAERLLLAMYCADRSRTTAADEVAAATDGKMRTKNNTTVSKWIEKERATCEISGALASSGEALDLVDDGADDGDVGNFYRRFRSQF